MVAIKGSPRRQDSCIPYDNLHAGRVPADNTHQQTTVIVALKRCLVMLTPDSHHQLVLPQMAASCLVISQSTISVSCHVSTASRQGQQPIMSIDGMP
jgi:hypothetical protein